MQIRKLAVATLLGAGALALSMQWTFARSAASRTQLVMRDSTPPLSAGMLRRIAEAADGYRTGRNVWFAVNETAPYEIVRVFEDAPGAAPRGARVVGPYLTPADFGSPALFVPVPHVPPTKYGLDSMLYWRLPPEAWKMEDIDSIVITAFRRGGGAPWHVSSPGRDIDAVFFTLAANDKFVFPYYARVSGLDATLRMRDGLLNYIRRVSRP
jgi:hypothetical protein